MLLSRTNQIKLRRASSLAFFFITFLFLYGPEALAQNEGVTAIGGATKTIATYIDPVRKLIYAIAAVVAIVGAFSVYFKMQNEEQDVKKSIMLVIGACVFLVAAATALPLFFNYNVK